MKTAVGLTHSAQHNGCASWSTGAAMNDDVSSLSKLARLQCSQQRTLAVQCTGGTADWGFFSCCVTDSLLHQSHSSSCCVVQFDCDSLHSFF